MKKGFTLIELLIVVAIIAILAAIAVPNFLEAQARSKVSRVRADMRNLANAIEMYRVDYNFYPPDEGYMAWKGFQCDANGNPNMWREKLGVLTSPIAYYTRIPVDPFGGPYSSLYPNARPGGTYFEPEHWYYYTDFWRGYAAASVKGNKTHGRFYSSWNPEYWRNASKGNMDGEDCWELFSTGPWKYWYSGPSNASNVIDGFACPYDPTNGTVSFGSIARWGP